MSDLFDEDAMYRQKSEHTDLIGRVLSLDPGSDVTGCSYFRCRSGEFVQIRYKGGGAEWINVTINSLGAIHREIVSEVYGSGAHGTIHSPEAIGRLVKELMGGDKDVPEKENTGR